jgi:hypothetical protein
VCKLRPAFGDEFEELTACHLMRYKQLLGYSTYRYCFIHAWPSKCNENGTVEQLESILEAHSCHFSVEFGRKELMKLASIASSCRMEHLLPKGAMWWLSMSTLIPILQIWRQFSANITNLCLPPRLGCIGGAHLVLLWRRMALQILLPKVKTWLHWWKSLGVAMEENGSANLAPKGAGCSATYSYEGLRRCCLLLEDVLKEVQPSAALIVEIGSHILAVSAKAPENLDNIVVPKSEQIQLWFHEMFEPTISVFPPCDALT